MKNKINGDNIMLIANHIGQELKFNELCQYLNIDIPKNSKHSKEAIIKQIKQYCDLEINSEERQPKYIIHSIYATPILAYHPNNKFQAYFEKALLLNLTPGVPKYLSNTEILRTMNLVNDNFNIASNYDLIKKIEEKEWMHYYAVDIYHVLYSWANRRLKQMDARHLIELQKGFRVYRHVQLEKGKHWIEKENVAKGSKLEEVCKEIFYHAISNTPEVPEDWAGEWLSYEVKNLLENNIQKYAKYYFSLYGYQWDSVKQIKVIIPIDNQAILNQRLKDVEEILNEEAQRKISSSKNKKLKLITDSEKNELVQDLIKMNPELDFKELLRLKEN